MGMNLANILEENLEKHGVYDLLHYEDKVYTNEYALEAAKKIASMITKHGVEKGDRVIVCMPNRPEVIFSYQGIVRTGAIVVPVMFLLQSKEIAYILKDSEAKAIITAQHTLPKILEAIEEAQVETKVFVADMEEGSGAENVFDLQTEMDKAGPTEEKAEIEEDDVAVILYTSGTTGRPKGVLLTHRNLYSNASVLLPQPGAQDQAQEQAQQEGPNNSLCVLPMAHVYGFTSTNMSILAGSRIVIIPRFDVEKVFAAIEKFKIRNFAAVPTMIHDMVNSPLADKYDLSSLESVASGSAPLAVSLIEKFQKKFNAVIREGYGLSETSSAVTSTRRDMPVKPGSVGKPIPGVEIKIVDEEGNEVPVGETGELLVRGPNVSPGYYKNEEATKASFTDGWFHTGDIAKVDEDGYLYIVDRKKELIIRGGFNIYPRDLEELLITHPAVAEVAVIGVPSERMGEEVVAFVVKKPGANVTEEELLQFCQENLVKYKTPRRIVFVDEMPRNGVGKVVKPRLKELAQSMDLGIA